jgi:hypothetical protein
MRIVTGVGDLVQRIDDGQAQVGYSMIGRSGGRVTPCVIYNMHMETRSASFLVEPQNQDCQVFRFGDLDIKITMTVYRFRPQNR